MPVSNGNEITYDVVALAQEVEPGLFHSRFALHNYYFTDRLDLFALGEAGSHALLIDVGQDELCGTSALDQTLANLRIDYPEADIFITHFHDDHDGNLAYCVEQGIRAIYHAPFIPYSDERCDCFMQATGANKAGDQKLRETTAYIMGKNRYPQAVVDKMVEVSAGDTFDIAGYSFEVVPTPGHTPEHSSLIDRSKGIMFAGDHLTEAPPGHLQLEPDAHILKNYFASMELIKGLGLNIAYLSHAEPIVGTDAIGEFIDGVIAKYEKPLGQIKTIVEESDGLTVHEAAQRYYEYLKGGFMGQSESLRMRRLAIMFGFLDYLYDSGQIDRATTDDGVLIYSGWE